MTDHVLLLRGINVGGKNKIKMAELRAVLEREEFDGVRTYIQSGNILVRSDLGSEAVSTYVEQLLVDNFALDSTLVRVLALTGTELRHVAGRAPDRFGVDTDTYRYDVIFCLDRNAEEVFEQTPMRPGIDSAWEGPGVVYYRHPSTSNPSAGKSHFSKIVGQPVYRSLTIRNWKTTSKLMEMLGPGG